MNKKEKKVHMETLFRALADRTRLRLINLLSDGEVCVCFFVEILGTNQPKISRHLAYLRRAGIVAARRDGKWIHYRINIPDDPYAAKLLADAQAWFSQDKEMQRDRQRLMKVCCAPQLPVQLQGAPRPVGLSSALGSG
jgi:ArsR family transcriptional regulator